MGMWNGSGGKQNDGESIEDAARRELQEEFNVEVTDIDLRAEIEFFLRQEDKLVRMFTFIVENWQGDPAETEEMKPEWFDVNEVPYNQMWASDHEWLPLILKGKRIKAKYTYDHEGGDVETREIDIIK